MSYQVLARKWRPRVFKEMIGQESILQMLRNALQQQRIHHAYLFTGTRGVGKTTVARILAKSLNCMTGITPDPCETCATCEAINQGRFLDLYEVDAASRTKVEDTRDLLENVLYPPTQGRFKIYLIDEVHMLSNHSFNALLKTLEEPPEHVKFLLATTDPKRLPITILSRCLQFHLKKLQPSLIASHLASICKTEQVSFENKALEKLAQSADGSMRDALSLLDQIISYSNANVSLESVNALLGSISTSDILPLFQAIAAKDGNALYQAISFLSEQAPDFHQVLEECITLLHSCALHQIVPDVQTLNDQTLLLTKQLTPEEIQIYYQIALLGRRDLDLNPSAQLGFEMIMLRMLAFTLTSEKKSEFSHPTLVSNPIPTSSSKSVALQTDSLSQPALLLTAETNVSPNQPVAELQTEMSQEWKEILPKLELTGMAFALASNCSFVKKTDNQVELAVSTHHLPMLNPKNKERITEALSRYFKSTIHLTINTSNTELFTPVKQKKEEASRLLVTAKEKVMKDPNIQKLIEMYDATVEISLLN